MGEDSGEKNEDATPHKLREARKKGQIAKGKELTGAVLLFVVFYVLKAYGYATWVALSKLSVLSFERIAEDFSTALIAEVLWEVFWFMFLLLGPLFASVMVVGFGLELMQTQFLFHLESVKPDINKINPIEGIKKFFTLKQYVEILKSIVKMIIVVWIIYFAIVDRLPTFLVANQMSLLEIMVMVADVVMTVIFRVGIFYVIIAILDYFYQRYEYMKSMKMSKKEVKDEYKKLEGDPVIKQRQRDLQREMAMGRQMGSVPGADVVVTNPVHIAVAIVYKSSEMNAPLVVARGKRLVANEIKQVAEAHYIPIVEDPPLAQTLYQHTRAGFPVPPQYYRAVAEILAFVYNLKKKRRKKV